jgi:DNA polymerase III epsilon subunit-like protein
VREIVFDTETTGLNPAGGDRIVEIGCIEIFNRVETGRHFHAYFNPERPMPKRSMDSRRFSCPTSRVSPSSPTILSSSSRIRR